MMSAPATSSSAGTSAASRPVRSLPEARWNGVRAPVPRRRSPRGWRGSTMTALMPVLRKRFQSSPRSLPGKSERNSSPHRTVRPSQSAIAAQVTEVVQPLEWHVSADGTAPCGPVRGTSAADCRWSRRSGVVRGSVAVPGQAVDEYQHSGGHDDHMEPGGSARGVPGSRCHPVHRNNLLIETSWTSSVSSRPAEPDIRRPLRVENIEGHAGAPLCAGDWSDVRVMSRVYPGSEV